MPQFTKNATAQWQGTGKEGSGNIKLESGRMDAPYSFKSRFEDGPGTNPEELIGAAHAGCFTMKANFLLNEAGFTAEDFRTKCDVEFKDGSIVSSKLSVEAKVPGITKEKFDAVIEDAKANCPISKLLNTEISATATLL